MTIHFKGWSTIGFFVLLPALAAGCADGCGGGGGPGPVPGALPLPAEPPTLTPLEFTQAGGWPPTVVGATDIELVPWTELPDSLTDADVLELRAAALADATVVSRLGARYAFISADEIEPLNKASAVSSLATRLTFFSHTNNSAVEVRIQGREVQSAEYSERAQPPEGRDEIAMAIELAMTNSFIAEVAAEMDPDAIVTFPSEGQPGAGNRVLYVAFSDPGELTTYYYALVDLTEQEVLEAGRAAGVGDEGQ